MGTSVTLEDSNTEFLTSDSKPLTCGIIMPIAAIGTDYSESHWKDVREILNEAIKLAGFIPRIVSDSEDSTIIHKSIINNIYNDSIVVCDVSGKNPNVMFELGMRLAFDKPVVIIKDDKTGYSFDTSNIQHLGYRKDLRHNTVENFIKELAIKIKATHEAPSKKEYQSFLSHFGKFEIAKIENTSILGSDALQKILEKVDFLQDQMTSITTVPKSNAEMLLDYGGVFAEAKEIRNAVNKIKSLYGHFVSIELGEANNLTTVKVTCDPNINPSKKAQMREEIKKILEGIDDLPF